MRKDGRSGRPDGAKKKKGAAKTVAEETAELEMIVEELRNEAKFRDE